MTHSSLKAVWDQDRAAIGGWVASGSEFSLDLYRRAQYDYIGIDCQHTAYNEAQAATMLQRVPAAARPSSCGCPRTTRPSSSGSATPGRTGSSCRWSIRRPRRRTAVAATRYPPRGVRSFGPNRSDLRADDLVALADRVSVFVMIETSDGLRNVDDITAVEGPGRRLRRARRPVHRAGPQPPYRLQLRPVARARRADPQGLRGQQHHPRHAPDERRHRHHLDLPGRPAGLARFGRGAVPSAAIAALKDAKDGEGKG